MSWEHVLLHALRVQHMTKPSYFQNMLTDSLMAVSCGDFCVYTQNE